MYVQLVRGMDAFLFGPRVRSVLPLDHQKEPGETIRPTQVRSADRELPFHRIGDDDVVRRLRQDGDEVAVAAAKNDAGDGGTRQRARVLRLDREASRKAPPADRARKVPALSSSLVGVALRGQLFLRGLRP